MDTLFFREPKQLSWFGRLSLFLRSNLFVPDSRSLWINPSYRRLRKQLAKDPVDAIITTGPPHSCHLIGLKLKQSTGIPWIADFRDPWLEIDYFPQLMLTNRTRQRHERMQQNVLSSADKVITVSWAWAELFRKYGARDVEVITNGFDPPDIPRVNPDPNPDDAFDIASIGTLEMDRNPTALWLALGRLLKDQPDLMSKVRIQLAGKVDGVIIEDAGVAAPLIQNLGYLSHHSALSLMQQADILLLLMNKIDSANTMGRIPGKLFEYIATGRPILMLGNPASDAGRLVAQLDNSWCVPYDDPDAILRILQTSINSAHTAGDFNRADLSRFERKTLTQDLAAALDGIAG
jgi:glycosyltransferase involved in cell wall biosynthesis